ncbi:MAG: SoxR reducing system RseC family protein [Gammaproteobacteria bacterium]|jgi:sigma-E factor negative regulatory protein RseC
MLEETARVVAIEGRQVWVETERRSSCSACSVQKGCGSAALAKVLGQRRSRLRVLSDMPLSVGDRVIIGVREHAVVRGSLAVYAVPLVMLLFGALAGELGARQFLWRSGELASIILGVGGLVAGVWWLKAFSGHISNNPDYQPVVLRRLANPAARSLIIE